MSYIHLINARDKKKIITFSETNLLGSNLWELYQLKGSINRKTPYALSIDELRYKADKLLVKSVSPREFFLIENSLLLRSKDGIKIDGIKASKELEQKILQTAERELKFEEVRQKKYFNLPSRLSAIFFVDNNEYGRDILQDMFRSIVKNPIIVEIGLVDKIEMFKTDYRWVSEYERNGEEEMIENYWKAIPLNGTLDEYHEYLYEGSIKIINQDDLDGIKIIRSNDLDYFKFVNY